MARKLDFKKKKKKTLFPIEKVLTLIFLRQVMNEIDMKIKNCIKECKKRKSKR